MPNSRQNRRTLAPRWQSAGLVHRVSTDNTLQTWLLDSASLTAKIRQICADMQVHILSEKWQIPLPTERQQLGMADGEKAWIRCVVLHCHNRPLIYARTVIPKCHAGNRWYALKKLGNRPLGEVLFQLKQVKRHPFDVALWPSLDWPHLAEFDSTPTTAKSYARKSLFEQHGQPLLLTEVFLQNPKNW